MAYFECPCCGEKTELHAPAPGERTIWASGVDRLARLRFRPDAAIAATDLAPVLDAVAAQIAACRRTLAGRQAFGRRPC